MKKTLSILGVLVIISSVVFARRLDDPSTSMAVLKSGSIFRLFYKGVNTTDVKVLILNADNQIVFSEKIRNVDGFVRPYNFSNLPKGNYKIELTDGNGLQTTSVSYLDENRDRLAHLIQVKGNNEKFILSVPNKGNDVLTITIYNDENTALYTETANITGDFAKVYSLNKIHGKVTFNVTDSKGNRKSLSREVL